MIKVKQQPRHHNAFHTPETLRERATTENWALGKRVMRGRAIVIHRNYFYFNYPCVQIPDYIAFFDAKMKK